MELIIKPTEICNFKCSFCSSTEIASSKKSLLSHDQIFRFLQRFPETRTIIVNGGDPLMVPPEYYWRIIRYLDDHQLPANLSFTTNLWDFYNRPERWTELFKNPRMGVCTSFHYGDTRRITKDRVYREEDFWKVSDLFLKEIGYRPEFISVITDENESEAIRNVELACKMNVVCKLNYAMASGIQQKPYVLSKIYRTYLEIYDRGLAPWEFNTQQMIQRIKHGPTVCPQNRSCDSGIRCLQPDGDYYSCGSFADDRDYPVDFEKEMKSLVRETPLHQDFSIQFMREECPSCPMFEICNGCRKTIKDLKNHSLTEDHCKLMKQLAPRILKLSVAGKAPQHDPVQRNPSIPQDIGHL